MQITFFIPIYNAERFVDEAILSVLNQDEPNFELLLIDDCSTDGSYEKAQSWAKRDKRICLLQNDKNRGECYTANRAIYSANGRYLFRLDADDIALPNRLSTQLKAFKAEGAHVIGSWHHVLNPDGSTYLFTVPLDAPTIKANLFMCGQNFSNPTTAFDLNLIRSNHLRYAEDMPVAGDLNFWVDCMVAGASFLNLPAYLIKYRVHGNNASRKDPNLMFNAQFRVRKKILQLWYPQFSAEQVDITLKMWVQNTTLSRHQLQLGLSATEFILNNSKISLYGEDRRLLMPYFQRVYDSWQAKLASG